MRGDQGYNTRNHQSRRPPIPGFQPRRGRSNSVPKVVRHPGPRFQGMHVHRPVLPLNPNVIINQGSNAPTPPPPNQARFVLVENQSNSRMFTTLPPNYPPRFQAFSHLPNNIYQTPPVTPDQQPAGAVNRPRPRSVSPVPSTSSISTERAFSILLDRFEALHSKVSEKFNALESKIPTLVENSLLDQVKKESPKDVTPKLNKESKISSISNSSIHFRESQVARKKSTMCIVLSRVAP